MRSILTIFLLYSLKVLCEKKIILDGITEMTNKNYLKILNDSEILLVYFYEEDSKKCKEMNEEINKLNLYINESKLDIKLVKVDVSKDEQVAIDFSVESIPKLKFVRYKYKIKNDYDGKKNIEEIKAFVNR